MRITDGAIVAAATLSNRYISDRFLPDKAIDLMDEAASRIRMEVESKPEEIETLDRRIIQMKIEESALGKESDAASKDRLANLQTELANLEQQSAGLTPEMAGRKGQDPRGGRGSRKSSTPRVQRSIRRSAPAISPKRASYPTAPSPASKSGSRKRRRPRAMRCSAKRSPPTTSRR